MLKQTLTQGHFFFPLVFSDTGNQFFGTGAEIQKSKDLLGPMCHSFIFPELIK